MLISEPKQPTCTRLAQSIEIGHDSINNFLGRENFEPRDLYEQTKGHINLTGGIISIDDTVLDKPYSNKTDLIGYYYSGKHHKAVQGINLITLYYTDLTGNSQPINYRLYDPKDNLTKNDYFQKMLDEVLAWGLIPSYITGDSWYSSKENLKHIKHAELGFMFAVKANRTVSIKQGEWLQVQQIDHVPKTGLEVWLKDFGFVTLYRHHFKDQVRHYVKFEPKPKDSEPNSPVFTSLDFEYLHDCHWQIETYHRTIKQCCSIEKFQLRRERKIRNHVFSALMAFVYLKQQLSLGFSSVYAWVSHLFTPVVAQMSRQVADDLFYLNPKFG